MNLADLIEILQDALDQAREQTNTIAALVNKHAELQRQLEQARKHAEHYAASAVRLGADTDEACPPWLTVPKFRILYTLPELHDS